MFPSKQRQRECRRREGFNGEFDKSIEVLAIIVGWDLSEQRVYVSEYQSLEEGWSGCPGKSGWEWCDTRCWTWWTSYMLPGWQPWLLFCQDVFNLPSCIYLMALAAMSEGCSACDDWELVSRLLIFITRILAWSSVLLLKSSWDNTGAITENKDNLGRSVACSFVPLLSVGIFQTFSFVHIL